MVPRAPREALAIGVGCRTATSGDELLRLVRRTAHSVCREHDRLVAVATITSRAAGAPNAVARILGLPLIAFPPVVLSHTRGVHTLSMRVQQAVGTGSVAEAAALAALGHGARLLVPRVTAPGCTCAIAAIAWDDYNAR